MELNTTGGNEMTEMTLRKAIEVLKQHKEMNDLGIGGSVYKAIDTVVRYFESPPAESEKIPEILKGTESDYMMQIESLIKNQHTMTPDWVIAHAMSIVGRAYSAGVDFVVEVLKLEKKGDE
jgi:hypothetical protein